MADLKLSKVGDWFKQQSKLGQALLLVALLALVVLLAGPGLRYKVWSTAFRRTSAEVIVLNKISGKPIRDVTVTYDDSKTSTNSVGSSIVKASKDMGTVTVALEAPGYEKRDNVTVQIDSSRRNLVVVDLLPEGKFYYYSNNDGFKVFMESNLDGSKTKELDLSSLPDDWGLWDSPSVNYLAARDWNHIAFTAHHESYKEGDVGSDGIFVINTKTEEVEPVEQLGDEGWPGLEFVGWADNSNFVYRIAKNEKRGMTLKSYNVETKKSTTLLTEPANDEIGTFVAGTFLVGGKVLVGVRCHESSAEGCRSGIVSINPVDGTHKLEKELGDDNGRVTMITSNIYGPDELYFSVYWEPSGVSYYRYDGLSVSDSQQDQAEGRTFRQILSSASGNKTYWINTTEQGFSMGVGDQNAKNEVNQSLPGVYSEAFIDDWGGTAFRYTGPGGYTPYGWYGDEYMILTRYGGLHITAPGATRDPLFVTNYELSEHNYDRIQAGSGYGGALFGYGFPF